MNPSVFFRLESIIFPLLSGILFDFPQIFVFFIFFKSRKVDKINRISSIDEILVHHTHFISNVFRSLLDVGLLTFLLLFFETSYEYSFSNIL